MKLIATLVIMFSLVGCSTIGGTLQGAGEDLQTVGGWVKGKGK